MSEQTKRCGRCFWRDYCSGGCKWKAEETGSCDDWRRDWRQNS